jgi:ribosomal protein S26
MKIEKIKNGYCIACTWLNGVVEEKKSNERGIHEDEDEDEEEEVGESMKE